MLENRASEVVNWLWKPYYEKGSIIAKSALCFSVSTIEVYVERYHISKARNIHTQVVFLKLFVYYKSISKQSLHIFLICVLTSLPSIDSINLPGKCFSYHFFFSAVWAAYFSLSRRPQCSSSNHYPGTLQWNLEDTLFHQERTKAFRNWSLTLKREERLRWEPRI